MDIEELPLLELFTRLQKAGLSLGIGEYKLLLQAIRGGFGFPDRSALARLCCTLWVKSPQDKRIFDYHFEQVIGKPNSLPLTSRSNVSVSEDFPKSGSAGEDFPKSETDLDKRQTNQNLRNLALVAGVLLLSIGIVYSYLISKENPTQNTEEEPSPNLIETPYVRVWGGLLGLLVTFVVGIIIFRRINAKSPPKLRRIQTASSDSVKGNRQKRIYNLGASKLSYERQISTASQNQANTSFPDSITQEINKIEIAQLVKSDRFLLKHEYFPITPRQMKQSWRYLRRLERSGKATELDIKATVNQISRQGFLLKPVFVAPRINRTQLLLLIDYDGSMLPFHRLADLLAETVQQAGKLGKTSIYYFQNCPLEYLYHDPYHQKAELISQILPKLDAKWTVALIFSDAGALRGGLSSKRIKLTADFLEQLRQQVNYLAWLNPMPHSRWKGTSAGEIACLVPMFEVSSQGFQETINVLRGYLKR